MTLTRMHLKVLLPFEVHTDNANVLSIVAETLNGSFGILPQRRDCIAALSPGILTFTTENEGESFLAIDEGVLVKTGPNVFISVARAIYGTHLEQLRNLVKKEFMALDENEKNIKLVMTKLESDLIRRLSEFQHV